MNDKPNKVERPDILRALRMGHDEIVTLRRRVAELEPKAHAYETISQIARLTVTPAAGFISPGSAMLFGEDAAWRIKQLVEQIEAERDAEHTTGAT
jgi:cystathionine beta-lyase/cystathionine gamma-synthase